MARKYEDKFDRLGEGFLGAKKEAKGGFQDSVHEHAKRDWRPTNEPLAGCCFRDCQESEPALTPVEISTAQEEKPVSLLAHDGCFSALRAGAVEPDDPKEHGRIPARARCVFCGKPLPLIGKHPFAFDVGRSDPPRRYWSHADCMLERLVPWARRELTSARST